jgi:hypothetical protein
LITRVLWQRATTLCGSSRFGLISEPSHSDAVGPRVDGDWFLLVPFLDREVEVVLGGPHLEGIAQNSGRNKSLLRGI